MLITTMDSNDLRVRARDRGLSGGLERRQDLRSVETLIETAGGDPNQTANVLWTLGLLAAARGGGPRQGVSDSLSEDPGRGALLGGGRVALVATDDLIEPLLGCSTTIPRSACGARRVQPGADRHVRNQPADEDRADLLGWMDETGLDDTTRGSSSRLA